MGHRECSTSWKNPESSRKLAERRRKSTKQRHKLLLIIGLFTSCHRRTNWIKLRSCLERHQVDVHNVFGDDPAEKARCLGETRVRPLYRHIVYGDKLVSLEQIFSEISANRKIERG